MNKKQYNNVIEWTMRHYSGNESDSSLEKIKSVCTNMGISLPCGTIQEVYNIMSTDEYMDWRSCTMEEAREYADSGIAVVGMNENRIVLIAAEDKEEPMPKMDSVITINEDTTAYAVSGLQFYASSKGKGGGGGTIRDPREKVYVRKLTRNDYFTVEFANGVKWESIECDMSLDTNRSKVPLDAIDRLSEMKPNEQRYVRNIKNTYTMKQLAILYMLDPLGIEYYIRKNAWKNIGYKQELLKKDQLFKEIYGVEARLFNVDKNGIVTYYFRPNNMSADERAEYYSEAEILFGYHTLSDLQGFLIEAFTAVFEALLGQFKIVDEVILGVKMYQQLFMAGSVVGATKDAASYATNRWVKNLGSKRTTGMWWVANLLYNIGVAAVDNLVIPHPQDMKIYNKIQKDSNYNLIFYSGNHSATMADVIKRCK